MLRMLYCSDIRHALRLSGAGSNSAGNVDQQCLVGARQQVDEGRDAPALAYGSAVGRLLGTLPQSTHDVHQHLLWLVHQ